MSFIKERVFQFFLIAFGVAAIFTIWFFTSYGTQGLMTWTPLYDTIFKSFLIATFMPVVTLIPWLIFRNRATGIVSYIGSGIGGAGWLVLFIVLSIMNEIGTPSKNLNLLKADDPLPVTSVAPDDVTTPVIRIGFGSDPHYGASHQNIEACDAILDGLASHDNDAVFLLGDIVEMGILNDYPAAIEDMEKHLGTIPLRVLPGNHDALVCALPHFKKMFNQKHESDYYRMDGGNVHILVLCVLWDDHDFGRRQEKWLIKQLEEIPEEDTVIAICHCYMYGSGTTSTLTGDVWGDIPTVIDRICPIFEKYNVDLVVNGHNHNFEYLRNNGTSYCVIGTMGGSLDERIDYLSPRSVWADFTDYGWLEATIYTDRIELEYLNETGSLLHKETVRTRN